MNKTLVVTLTTATLSIALPAYAETTLYGSLHTSIDVVDDGSDSNNISLSNNQSYLGVKGSEKITDDLSAVYKIEFAPDMGGKGRDLDDRDQYVGLSSKQYGSVLAGRMSSPYKIVHAKADLFWYSQLGSNRSLTTDGFRNDNTIAYFSPKIGGFTASLAHVTEGEGRRNDNQTLLTGEEGNQALQNDNWNLWSGNLFYKVGGMTLGAGYEKNNSVNEAINLMASYQMGKFKVVGFAERMEFSDTVLDPILEQAANASNIDSSLFSFKDTDVSNNTYGIGVSMKTNSGIIKAQYYTKKHNQNTVLKFEGVPADNLPSTDDPINFDSKSTLFSLGYDHKLSKRTTVYAQYALSKNNNSQEGRYFAQLGSDGAGTEGSRDAYGAAVESTDPTTGQATFAKTVSGVSFGIKHNF